jgi:uncharacterized protein
MKRAVDIGFTKAVKAVQLRKGSHNEYADAEWRVGITDELVQFLSTQRSVFLATVNSDGYPYIQHRGGPPGFISVLSDSTLGFADFRGNRQFITQGNLSENDRANLFVIDYAHRRRVKIWGRAQIVENDSNLMAKLVPENYRARSEQALVFTVEAWDINCPQHIPQRFEAEDVARVLAEKDARIKELENEIAVLDHKASVSDACGDDLWEK